MFDEQDRKYFYNEFKNNGYEVGSYDDFKQDLNNKEDRDWYYNEAKNMGYDVGSQEDFDKMVLDPALSSSTTSTAPSTSPSPVATSNQQAKTIQHPQANNTQQQAEPTKQVNESHGLLHRIIGMPMQHAVVSNGTYQPAPVIEQPIVDGISGQQQEHRAPVTNQPVDAVTGANNEEDIDAIFGKYIGKADAISETIADLMASGKANSQEQAQPLAMAAMKRAAQRLAKRTTDDFVGKLGDTVANIDQSIYNSWYSHKVQDILKNSAAQLGIQNNYFENEQDGVEEVNSYDQFINSYVKPAMVQSLVHKYGENYRKQAEDIATRLYSHDDAVQSELMNRDINSAIEGVISKYVKPSVVEEYNKAQEAGKEAFNASANGNLHLPGSAFTSLMAESKANDAQKTLDTLNKKFANLYKNGFFLTDIANATYNVMQQYGAQGGLSGKSEHIKPMIQGVLKNELTQLEVKGLMPKGSADYIIKSGLGNTILGKIERKTLHSDYQNWLEDMANQQYQPGFWENVASGALTFAGDAWSYWLPGAAGGKITKAMLAKAEGTLATDLFAKGMGKKAAERAAKLIVGRSKGMALKQGMAHGATTFGGQAVVSTPVNEIYKEGQPDEEGKTYKTSVGKILYNTLGDVAKGAAIGAIMQGGTLANIAGKGRGLAANILADVGGKIADSSIMAGQSIIEHMAADPSFKPTGKDAARSFLESMANLTAIGLPGMMGKYSHFKSAQEFNRKYDFTNEDLEDLNRLGYGNLYEAFKDMGINDNRMLEGEGELMGQLSQMYMDFMSSKSVPETLKAKVMAVVEGKRLDSFSPVMDSQIIQPVDGKPIVETYNENGGIIERKQYSSIEAAEKANRELDYEKSLNLTAAYESAYHSDAMQDRLNTQYQLAVNKYNIGEKLSDEDKAAIYLHQNADAIKDVVNKQQQGMELTDKEQQLWSSYKRIYDGVFENSPIMKEYIRTFEDSMGVSHGSLRKALEGDGKSRTEEQQQLVEAYQKQLYGDIVLRRDGRMDQVVKYSGNPQEGNLPQLPATSSNANSEKTIEENAAERTAIPADGDVPPSDGGTPPSPSAAPVENQPAHSTTETSPSISSEAYVMGQNAYNKGDSDVLKAISRNDDLSVARLQRIFKDNEGQAAAIQKAYSEGKDMEEYIYQRSNYLTSVQKDAIRKYVEAQAAKKGVYDALQHADDGLAESLEEQLAIYTNENGEIVPATLTDGSRVFIKKQHDGGGAFAVVPGNDGLARVKQIADTEIMSMDAPVPLNDYIAQMVAAKRSSRTESFISNYTNEQMKPGDEVELLIGGTEPTVTQFVRNEPNGNVTVAIEGKEMTISKQNFDDWSNNATSLSINKELDAEDAAQAEAEKKQRFAGNIVGYGEGQVDYSSKGSDPKVVAEYLQDEYGDDHKKLISLINGSRQDIKEQLDNKKKSAAEYESWLDTNADLDPNKAQKINDELKLVNEQISDLEARYKNWNIIRNSVMTEEETRAMRDERKKTIEQAGVDDSAIITFEEREVPVLKDEQLKKQYPTMDEASAYIASQRKVIYKIQSDEVQNELNGVNDMLERYTNGEIDLEPEQLKELNTTKAQLEARHTNLNASAKELKAQADKLKTLYRKENAAERAKAMENLSPAEQRAIKVENAIKDNNLNALINIYEGTSVDFLDDSPNTVKEYVANSLGRNVLNFEGKEVNGAFSNGVSQETGLTRKDFNKLQVLAKEGDGMTVAEFVHKLYDNLPDNLREQGINDIDIRNALLDILGSAETYQDIKNYSLREKVANAENEMRALDAEEERMREEYEQETMVDKQGNPINEDGSLKLEQVKSVEELTDDDFLRPSRNVQLPTIPSNVDAAIGANGKPVVIKKNIFERNMGRHGDITPEQGRQIFKVALYNADLYGQNQKTKRPYNWVLINTKDEKGKNRTILLEVNPNKDNVEVVHWYFVNDKNLELIKKQAIREGDQVLILPSDNSEEVGGLSNLTDDLSSGGKDTNISDNNQKNGQFFSERLKNAIAETETEPTDAQKKAGNYKKGHLSFGGYNFTVETPKGATRSGKDENGKPWSVTMHDTYGYILGKIGVDGDHIDMFINDSADLDNFNDDVVVIDQVNPETGEFDEHKVMYGYPDEAAATTAYLKNYSKDWKGLGKVTSVPKATFDKWLESSDRKTKPFREYAMVKYEQAKNQYKNLVPTYDFMNDENLAPEERRAMVLKNDESYEQYYKRNGGSVVSPPTPRDLQIKRAYIQQKYKDQLGQISSVFNMPMKDHYDGYLMAEGMTKAVGANLDDLDAALYLRNDDVPLRSKALLGYMDGVKDLVNARRKGEELGLSAIDSEGTPVNQNSVELAEWAKEQGLVPDKGSKWTNYSDLYIECKDGFGATTLVPDKGDDINEVFYFPSQLRRVDGTMDFKRLQELAKEFNVGRDIKHSADTDTELTEGVVFYDGDTAREFRDFVNQKLDEERLPFGGPMNIDDLPFMRTVKPIMPKDMNEVQLVAFKAVRTMLKNAGIPVKVISNEDMDKVAAEYDDMVANMLLHDPNLRFNIKTPEERDAAERAYNWGKENRPDKWHQYVLVNMDRPNQMPEYFQKKSLADIQRRYYNKSVYDDWGELRGKPWGNYKLFDLNRPFEEQVKDVKGSVPTDYDPHKMDNSTPEKENAPSPAAESQKEESSEDKYAKLFSLLNKKRNLETEYEEAAHNLEKYTDELLSHYRKSNNMAADAEVPGQVFMNAREAARAMYKKKMDACMTELNNLQKEIDALAPGGRVSFLKGKSVAYGYTDGKQIVLNQDYLNPNTPLHEYQHIWRTAAKEQNPDLIKHGDDLIRKTSLYGRVKSDPNYSHLSDEEICDEAFARLIGQDGEKILENMANEAIKQDPFETAKELSVINRLKKWLKEFWYWTLNTFTKWKPEDIKKMTLQDIRNLVLRDLANGVDPRNVKEPLRDSERLSPEVANTPVKVVNTTADHGFKNFAEAKEWAKENLVREYNEKETGGKGVVNISNTAVDKYLSESAIAKSKDKDVHLSVLKVLSEVLRESVDAIKHGDRKKVNGKRDVANGINPDVTIHRCYGAVSVDSKMYGVKITLKENVKTKENTKLYSYETTKIELLDGQHGDVTMTSPRNSNNSITVAKIVNSFETSKENGEKISLVDKKNKITGRSLREIQLDIINDTNPMLDDYHTGIRKVEDIKTFQEAFDMAKADKEKYGDEQMSSYPDLTDDILNDALESGEITIYSSKPIKNGNFVTPSRMQAEEYAGDGKVYEKKVSLTDVAWIDVEQGQYAKVPSKKRFMFAGENGAGNLDTAEQVTSRLDNLTVAKKMLEAKQDAKSIKYATGWELGKDGKWRYEIPDAKLSEYMDLGDGSKVKRYEEDMLWNGGALGDYVDAPELFKAYPSLKGIILDTDTLTGDQPSNGAYSPELNKITIHASNLKYLNSILNHEIQHTIQYNEGFAKGGSPNTVRKRIESIIDENKDVADYARRKLSSWAHMRTTMFNLDRYKDMIQSDHPGIKQTAVGYYADAMHVIDNDPKSQLVNDWDKFGDKTIEEIAESGYHVDEAIAELSRLSDEHMKEVPEGNKEILNVVNKLQSVLDSLSDEQIYWNLAGEVESRNVENRLSMTPEERRNSLASETEDVDRADQIVMDGDGASYSIVANPETIKKLNKEDTIKVYRAMQVGEDGKLYPPMAAKVKGKMVQPIELGKWEQADERPELADDKGQFTLNKGNGKSLKAAYNPYLHTSYTPLNDQFSEAQNRPNIVTVEVEVPKSELTSGYKADKAKDSVGAKEWKAGIIQGQLTGTRTVVLSRYDKPVRIVPDSEVANVIVNDMFKGKDITMPSNVVTPSLRKELEKLGVPFVETDNRGRIIGGEYNGIHYSKVYGKKRTKENGVLKFSLPDTSGKLSFGEQYDYEKYPLGKVEPNLATKEIKIISADANHGFKNYKEAKSWALANLCGVYSPDETGGKGEVVITTKVVNKYISSSDKSSSVDVHFSVLKVLPEVIKEGIDTEVHPNFRKIGNERKPEYGFDDHVLVHRIYGAVDIEGTIYRVKITMKENIQNKDLPNKPYFFEVTDISTKIEPTEVTNAKAQSNGDHSVSSILGAKLLKNVEMSYAKGKKLLDESEKSELSVNNLAETAQKVKDTAAQLGGAEANVYVTINDVPEKYRSAVQKGARGWYDPKTHTVHVCLPNCADAAEAQRTVFHEKIGHEGMEVLLGGENEVRKFADYVYKNVGKDIRGKILDFANKYDPDWKNEDRMNVGTQEYIAHLAEDGAKTEEEFSLWTKIKHYLLNLLKKMGINIPGLLNDKDLRYYLMKAGKALHVWDEMPKEKQDAIKEQASAEDVKNALSENGGEEGKKRLSERKRIELETGPIRLAPNGAQTSLSKKQFIEARTKKFKEWFGGDWEKSPKKFTGKLDANGEPLEKYVEGFLHRPKKPTFPRRRKDEDEATYFQRQMLHSKALEDFPETEEAYKQMINELDDVDFSKIETPQEDEIRKKYMAQYEKDLAEFKEDAGIPANAERPAEPKPSDYDNLLDLSNAWGEFHAWDYAPEAQDYERMADDEITSRLAVLNAIKHPYSEADREKAMNAEFYHIRRMMSSQRTIDKNTANAVVQFARRFMALGYGDNLGRGAINKLLRIVRNSVGTKQKHMNENLYQVMNLLMDNQLRNLDNAVVKTMSIKELKENAKGIQVQGKLELRGQATIKAFRNAIGQRLSSAAIDEKISGLIDRMTDDKENAASYQDELLGLQFAKQYIESIDGSRADAAEIESLKKEEIDSYNKGTGKYTDKDNRNYNEHMDILRSYNEALFTNKLDRMKSYATLLDNLGGMISESIQGAKEFVERESARAVNIKMLASADLSNKSLDQFRKENWKTRLANGNLVRFLFAPTGSFDAMLREFGSKNVDGEGDLWNHFIRGCMDASDGEYLGVKQAENELDLKVSELFGKVSVDKNGNKKGNMLMSDLYKLQRSSNGMPTLDVTIHDIEGNKTFTLQQGNLMYIYMVNKMTDGAMKLRQMGITEADVDRIKDTINPKMLKLADWIQGEFLPKLRTKYNKRHEELFGAPMPIVENYFPLRVLKSARYQEEDVNNTSDGSNALPSVATGAIIKRRINKLPLDILNADALSVTLENVREMENWYNYAPIRKDANVLLSDTAFRNRVQNMVTIYGSGERLWNNFKDATAVAMGTYRPKGNTDTAIAIKNIAKGVTGAKITFRLYTAFKQTLSAPLFLPDVNIGKFLWYSINPKGCFEWAIKNMPDFEKRWLSRKIGDTVLMNDPTDWKLWRNELVKKATYYGMTPNAFVDAVTVAVGARAVYDSKYKAYIASGMDEVRAKGKALQDAAINFNTSQQSSENAFVSPMQLDRTLESSILTPFRNSSMLYERKGLNALRNLKHRFEKGYKEASVKFMAGQLMDDGVPYEKAKKAAERMYNKGLWHNIATATVALWIGPIFWNFGTSLGYLLFGDDNNKKKKMIADSAILGLLEGPIDGLNGGQFFNSAVANTITSDGIQMKGLKDLDLSGLPMLSDMSTMMQKFGYDKVAAAQDLMFIVMQSATGFNPKTLTDAVNACIDYSHGDMTNAKEIALFIFRLTNGPAATTDNLYIDELGMTGKQAKKLSYEELAKRYGEYKFGKNTFGLGGFYSDEEIQDKLSSIEKSFDEKVSERLAGLDRDDLTKEFDVSRSQREKKLIGKIIADEMEAKDSEATKAAKGNSYYLQQRNFADLSDDLYLQKQLESTTDVVKGLQELKDNGAGDSDISAYKRKYKAELDKHKKIQEARKKMQKVKTKITSQNDEANMREIRSIRDKVIRTLRLEK